MSDKPLDQATIDALLRNKRGKGRGAKSPEPGVGTPPVPAAAPPAERPSEPPEAEAPHDGRPAASAPAGAARAAAHGADMRQEVSEAISEIPVEIAVVLGDLELPIGEVLKLQPGSIVQLEAQADLPVEIRLRGRTVARAQIVVLEDTYGLRIVENLVATPDFPSTPRP